MPAEPLVRTFNQAWASREQEYLGWLITARDLSAARLAASCLKPEHFCDGLHAQIHWAISTILEQGKAPTVIALGHFLAESLSLKDAGGREYLQNLAVFARSTANGTALAAEVRENGVRYRGSVELRALADDFLRSDVSLMDTEQRICEFQRTTLGGQLGHSVKATPFRWIAPELIPPRKFLFVSRHSIAGYSTATGAPGGLGKSSCLYAEGLAHATKRNLLNDMPLFRGKTWILGYEDQRDEHQRRLAATALLHKIEPREFEGRLYLDTAEQDLVIARTSRDGFTVSEPVVEGIIDRIRELGITFLIVDPFVASHGVPENDNGAIDAVARLWGRIAGETGCAVELVHHLRKASNGNSGKSGNKPTVDDFRGASALIPAVRAARMFMTMTKEEAERAGIDEPLRYFRVIDGKRNMAARSTDCPWRELIAIDLRNGGETGPSDNVAAVAAWTPPDASTLATSDEIEAIKSTISSGVWRADIRSKDWAGNAIAQVMELDLRDDSARKAVDRALKGWIKRGVLCVKERKHPSQRKAFGYVEVPS